MEEVVVPDSGDEMYTSDSSVLNDETLENQGVLSARNPCPGWTVGSVAIANFNLPGLPNQIQIERLISQARVRELEANIEAAWSYEAEEISKEEERTVEGILSTLTSKYLQIQLEELKQVIAMVMRKLELELGLPVSPEELNSKQAEAVKWLELA